MSIEIGANLSVVLLVASFVVYAIAKKWWDTKH